MKTAPPHRQQVIGRLFAVLTARLEDAAMLAVDAQRAGPDEQIEAAKRLSDIGEETSAIAEALLCFMA